LKIYFLKRCQGFCSKRHWLPGIGVPLWL